MTSTSPEKIADHTAALPASFATLEHGAARITIGQTTSTYANAAAAADWLRAMQRDGHVRIINPRGPPVTAPAPSREDLELQRLRDLVAACLIGQYAAGAVALFCALLVRLGGPDGFLNVSLFELVVMLLFAALWRRLRARLQRLEGSDR